MIKFGFGMIKILNELTFVLEMHKGWVPYLLHTARPNARHQRRPQII